MHIGTPVKPNPMGRLLLKLSGHILPATKFISDPLDNLLISVSEDNYLKVWDLQTISTICKLYVDHPNIHMLQYSEDKQSESL